MCRVIFCYKSAELYDIIVYCIGLGLYILYCVITKDFKVCANLYINYLVIM